MKASTPRIRWQGGKSTGRTSRTVRHRSRVPAVARVLIQFQQAAHHRAPAEPQSRRADPRTGYRGRPVLSRTAECQHQRGLAAEWSGVRISYPPPRDLGKHRSSPPTARRCRFPPVSFVVSVPSVGRRLQRHCVAPFPRSQAWQTNLNAEVHAAEACAPLLENARRADLHGWPLRQLSPRCTRMVIRRGWGRWEVRRWMHRGRRPSSRFYPRGKGPGRGKPGPVWRTSSSAIRATGHGGFAAVSTGRKARGQELCCGPAGRGPGCGAARRW